MVRKFDDWWKTVPADFAKVTNQTSPYSTKLTMFFCIFIWQASMMPNQAMMS
jgi:hypothetical protein